MFSTLTVVFLFFLFHLARSSPCIVMDANFNLLVFGLNGKDFNAGTQDTWTGSTPATDITTSGRPPFDGAKTTCYLSQFTNAIYVMLGDMSNPTDIFIFDAAAKSWSKQAVNANSGGSGSPQFSPTNAVSILDHDTNVFYSLSGGEVFFLDMMALKSANSTALRWTDVGKPSFDTTDYLPVMALANNHVHFLDVPGLQPGQADIFVIHFSFFQPTPQLFPTTTGSGDFPTQHGQTASFFQTSDAQKEFAFIPDDGSATYVVNVITNTTQKLAGPTTKDSKATYFAGITSLVQLDSKGTVMFLPYQMGNTDANTQAAWTKVTTVTVPPNSTGNGGASQGGGSGSSSGSSNGHANGAVGGVVSRKVTTTIGIGVVVAFAVGSVL